MRPLSDQLLAIVAGKAAAVEGDEQLEEQLDRLEEENLQLIEENSGLINKARAVQDRPLWSEWTRIAGQGPQHISESCSFKLGIAPQLQMLLDSRGCRKAVHCVPWPGTADHAH